MGTAQQAKGGDRNVSQNPPILPEMFCHSFRRGTQSSYAFEEVSQSSAAHLSCIVRHCITLGFARTWIARESIHCFADISRVTHRIMLQYQMEMAMPWSRGVQHADLRHTRHARHAIACDGLEPKRRIVVWFCLTTASQQANGST